MSESTLGPYDHHTSLGEMLLSIGDAQQHGKRERSLGHAERQGIGSTILGAVRTYAEIYAEIEDGAIERLRQRAAPIPEGHYLDDYGYTRPDTPVVPRSVPKKAEPYAPRHRHTPRHSK